MALSDTVKEWWIKALLGEQASAHPVFGEDIHVDVDGDVVTLTGTVENPDDAEEIEREVQSIGEVHAVVNRLAIAGADEVQHWQTIIAIFPDAQTARLGCGLVDARKLRGDQEPQLLEDNEQARDYLRRHVRNARIPVDQVQRYLQALAKGKALLVDRVAEDDALRIISALEGTDAESIYTLPPEPDAVETR